jgi:hypothetical protein
MEHEDIPKEDATVEIGRPLNKQHRDWLLAEKHRQESKDWTRDNVERARNG